MRSIQIMEHGSKAIPSEVVSQNVSLGEIYRVHSNNRLHIGNIIWYLLVTAKYQENIISTPGLVI